MHPGMEILNQIANVEAAMDTPQVKAIKADPDVVAFQKELTETFLADWHLERGIIGVIKRHLEFVPDVIKRHVKDTMEQQQALMGFKMGVNMLKTWIQSKTVTIAAEEKTLTEGKQP